MKKLLNVVVNRWIQDQERKVGRIRRREVQLAPADGDRWDRLSNYPDEKPQPIPCSEDYSPILRKMEAHLEKEYRASFLHYILKMPMNDVALEIGVKDASSRLSRERRKIIDDKVLHEYVREIDYGLRPDEVVDHVRAWLDVLSREVDDRRN